MGRANCIFQGTGRFEVRDRGPDRQSSLLRRLISAACQRNSGRRGAATWSVPPIRARRSDIDLRHMSATRASRRLFRVGEMPTSRIEAFSDGVFAIVITLLILTIQVPQLPG